METRHLHGAQADGVEPGADRRRSVVGDGGLFARFLSQGRLCSANGRLSRMLWAAAVLRRPERCTAAVENLARRGKERYSRPGPCSENLRDESLVSPLSVRERLIHAPRASDIAERLVNNALHAALVQLGIIRRGHLALLFRSRSELLQGRGEISVRHCEGISLHMTRDWAE